MINEMRAFVLELVQSEYETGHKLAEDKKEFNELCRDEGYRATKAMWDLYEECHNLGPAGFYAEYKDELDFDPMFVEEYGDEDDETDEDDSLDSADGFNVYDRVHVKKFDFNGQIIDIKKAPSGRIIVEVRRDEADGFFDPYLFHPDELELISESLEESIISEALSNKEKLKRAYPELNFDNPVIEPLNEAVDAEDKMQTAVGILYDMDNFVLSVYDNDYWLTMGVPDGEFDETDRDIAEANYKDHEWLIEGDEEGSFDREAFKDFLDAFQIATSGKDYDQNERARIIHEAEVILNMNESVEDMDRRCEECNTLLNDMGKCPKCDEGEEDMDESILTEASPADTIRSFDGYKGYKLEGNKLLRIRRGRNGLRRDYTGKSFDDASDAVAYVNNLPKVLEDIEEEKLLDETLLTEADVDTKIQRNRDRANAKADKLSAKLKVQADKVVQNDHAHKDAKTWTFYIIDKNGKIKNKYSQVEFMSKFRDNDQVRYNAVVVDASGNFVRRGTEWLYKKGYKFYPNDLKSHIPLEKYTYEGVYDLPPFFASKGDPNRLRAVTAQSDDSDDGDDNKEGIDDIKYGDFPGGKDVKRKQVSGDDSDDSKGSNGAKGKDGADGKNGKNSTGKNGASGKDTNADEDRSDADDTDNNETKEDAKDADDGQPGRYNLGISKNTFSHFLKLAYTMKPKITDAMGKPVSLETIKDVGTIKYNNLLDYEIEINGKKQGLVNWMKNAVKHKVLAEMYDDSMKYDEYDDVDLDEGLTTEEFRELMELANEIGIETVGELDQFKQEQHVNDDALLDYMRQYRDDLGDDFVVVEEDLDPVTDLEDTHDAASDVEFDWYVK